MRKYTSIFLYLLCIIANNTLFAGCFFDALKTNNVKDILTMTNIKAMDNDLSLKSILSNNVVTNDDKLIITLLIQYLWMEKDDVRLIDIAYGLFQACKKLSNQYDEILLQHLSINAVKALILSSILGNDTSSNILKNCLDDQVMKKIDLQSIYLARKLSCTDVLNSKIYRRCHENLISQFGCLIKTSSMEEE